ncbi:MAG: hypothetical protein NC930_09465, partial [Candidatus Omnitrophica bacterium]|nr:hypothetical protein [Candidatus Omnitrophota bacterium]
VVSAVVLTTPEILQRQLSPKGGRLIIPTNAQYDAFGLRCDLMLIIRDGNTFSSPKRLTGVIFVPLLEGTITTSPRSEVREVTRSKVKKLEGLKVNERTTFVSLEPLNFPTRNRRSEMRGQSGPDLNFYSARTREIVWGRIEKAVLEGRIEQFEDLVFQINGYLARLKWMSFKELRGEALRIDRNRQPYLRPKAYELLGRLLEKVSRAERIREMARFEGSFRQDPLGWNDHDAELVIDLVAEHEANRLLGYMFRRSEARRRGEQPYRETGPWDQKRAETREGFFREMPVFWRELGMEKEDYLVRREQIRALAGILAEFSEQNSGAYAVDLLEAILPDSRIAGNPEWSRAVRDLIHFVQTTDKNTPGQQQNFPTGNLAFQALIEMIRTWPKKERHTHISMSIPEEMIIEELKELGKDWEYRLRFLRKLYEKIDLKKEGYEERLVQEKLQFAERLRRTKDWGGITDAFRNAASSWDALRDLWMEALNPAEFQAMVIQAFKAVVYQNFADGITDLELRFNPFKTTGVDKSRVEHFLVRLAQAAEEVEKAAMRDFPAAVPYRVCFMFSLNRRRMAGNRWASRK